MELHIDIWYGDVDISSRFKCERSLTKLKHSRDNTDRRTRSLSTSVCAEARSCALEATRNPPLRFQEARSV